MTGPLYRRVLGARFDQLPPKVRELHDLQGTAAWVGRADVERGRSWVARIGAALTSLPPTGKDQPLQVTFAQDGDEEIWSRRFGTSLFRSVQYQDGGRVCERVWPVTFVFALDASGEGLGLKLEGLRLLGVPMPRFAHPAITTFESDGEGRYRFGVEARLPLFGLLVRYAGWLERAGAGSSA